jgi:hypothetical protein
MEDQRRFTRIVFTKPASLAIEGQLYRTKLIDLSLKGALIEVPLKPANFEAGTRCNLSFTLGE